MAQILTGHGCFNAFLHSIGKSMVTYCFQCGEQDDTAQHNLESCPRWFTERNILKKVLDEEELKLPNIIAKIVHDEEGWKAFANFCESVIKQEEKEEREIQRIQATFDSLNLIGGRSDSELSI